MGKYKNLNWNNRLQIEALWNAKHTVKEIAEQIGVHQSTIYRELKRGKTVKRKSSDWSEQTIYSPDLAQNRADEKQKEKGRPLKVGNDWEFVHFVEDMIIQKRYSPAAVLAIVSECDNGRLPLSQNKEETEKATSSKKKKCRYQY